MGRISHVQIKRSLMNLFGRSIAVPFNDYSSDSVNENTCSVASQFMMDHSQPLPVVQLLALLPHRHAKAAVLRWGPQSRRIGGEN